MKELFIYGFRKILYTGSLLRGNFWFQSSWELGKKSGKKDDILKGVPGSPLPTMIWIELGMTNMDGGSWEWYGGDMESMVHMDVDGFGDMDRVEDMV